jgi:hypothetical protein
VRQPTFTLFEQVPLIPVINLLLWHLLTLDRNLYAPKRQTLQLDIARRLSMHLEDRMSNKGSPRTLPSPRHDAALNARETMRVTKIELAGVLPLYISARDGR